MDRAEENGHEDLQARLQILRRAEVLQDHQDIIADLNILEGDPFAQADLARRILPQLQDIMQNLERDIDIINRDNLINILRDLNQPEEQIAEAIGGQERLDRYNDLIYQVRALDLTVLEYIVDQYGDNVIELGGDPAAADGDDAAV